jgi:hypothetical protein
MNNVVNQVAYLPTSRNFPPEINQLTVEINKSYVDIASAVNGRTISIFPATRPAINGESWFLNNQRQQGFRQVYSITSYASFDTGILIFDVNTFTRIYGVVIAANNAYIPIPYVDGGTTTSNVGIFLSPGTNPDTYRVAFTPGGTNPGIKSGIIILEWISQV